MSRMIFPFSVNGIVLVNGAKFWRIDDLSRNVTDFEFLATPAALVPVNEQDPEASHQQARVVCHALNSHRAQALMKLAMPAEDGGVL